MHEIEKSNDAGSGKQAKKLTLASAMLGKCKLQDSRITKNISKHRLVCDTAQLRSVHTFEPLSLSVKLVLIIKIPWTDETMIKNK